MTRTTWGRVLLTGNAVLAAVGGFLADFNKTHLFNPRWPPHAKFHDGQTMAIGVLLGATSAWFAWRPGGDAKTNIAAAAIAGGTLYWSQALANLFPGVAWTDPDLLKPGQTLEQFSPQLYLDFLMTVAVVAGAWMALSPTGRSPARGGVR